MYKTILCAGASLLFLGTANADCPTLNLETLPKATCANNGAPFKTGPLSKMSYVSVSPCPSGIGFKKKAQAIFKGKKDYLGREIKEKTKVGEVSCTYKLDATWQKVLTTTSSEVVIKTFITTPDQVNYLSPQACPSLTADEFDLIKEGKSFPMESSRKAGVVFNFKVMPLQNASAGARFKELFNTKNVQLINLQGVMKIEKPFEHYCEYNHNTGGSAVTSVLHGVQDGRVLTAR